MDQKRSQIRAATFADAEQFSPAAAGVLPGNQAQPYSEVPSIIECPSVADRGGSTFTPPLRSLTTRKLGEG